MNPAKPTNSPSGLEALTAQRMLDGAALVAACLKIPLKKCSLYLQVSARKTFWFGWVPLLGQPNLRLVKMCCKLFLRKVNPFWEGHSNQFLRVPASIWLTYICLQGSGFIHWVLSKLMAVIFAPSMIQRISFHIEETKKRDGLLP